MSTYKDTKMAKNVLTTIAKIISSIRKRAKNATTITRNKTIMSTKKVKSVHMITKLTKQNPYVT